MREPGVSSSGLEDEVRTAIAEGLVDVELAAQLAEDARRLGRSPLELLLDRGVITAATLASLRRATFGTGDTLDAPPAMALGPLPSAFALSAGAALFPVPGWDRYEPVRLLGQGAMGRVFLARDLRLRRDVAIKFMRGDEPELARRFVAEARAQARVSHERVCKVYEVGEVEGKVYIAMQHIDGRPLGDLRSELTVEQIAMLVRGAALGVNEAHRAGLIHRDLKPSNIMVERAADGELRSYVMDFGLARDWNEHATMTGTVLGTPHFMAPEQARGEVTRLDRRADVYSLGATLYALLAGKPPFPGDHPLEVLANIAVLEPQPLRAIDRDLPADLEAIPMKCLEKDRSARYDSARALADDLGRFLAGEPVEARATGLGYRLRKRLRKHARLVAGLTVALVVMLGAVGDAVR
ncbi:MAG TPA: serine/threonine-protein kinase, partial [Kofleriaceae bacterium]